MIVTFTTSLSPSNRFYFKILVPRMKSSMTQLVRQVSFLSMKHTRHPPPPPPKLKKKENAFLPLLVTTPFQPTAPHPRPSKPYEAAKSLIRRRAVPPTHLAYTYIHTFHLCLMPLQLAVQNGITTRLDA